MKQLIYLLIALFTILISSCNKELIEETKSETFVPFFLKNPDGTLVDSLDKQLLPIIYDDLIVQNRFSDAENLIKTYSDSCNYRLNFYESKLKSSSTTLIDYGFHSQNIGWIYSEPQNQIINQNPYVYILGTENQSKRLEAFYLILSDRVISYEAHVEGIGWQGRKYDGEIAGTDGASKRIEAVRFWLQNGIVFYQSHLERKGWETTWSSQGRISGTTGQSLRVEAVRVKFYLY